MIWQSLLPVDLPIAAPARPVDPRKPPSRRETQAEAFPNLGSDPNTGSDPDPNRCDAFRRACLALRVGNLDEAESLLTGGNRPDRWSGLSHPAVCSHFSGEASSLSKRVKRKV